MDLGLFNKHTAAAFGLLIGIIIGALIFDVVGADLRGNMSTSQAISVAHCAASRIGVAPGG